MTPDPPDDPNPELLQRLTKGDPQAAAELLPAVYAELRRMAGALLSRERRNHTLQPTELISEAYLRVSGSMEFEGDGHFFRVAARAMRNALVDHARGRGAAKRGGDRARITLDENLFVVAGDERGVLAIDEALDRLAATDARLAEIVELKFFAGLTNEQTAQTLEMSLRSVERAWRLARAWLVREMEGA